MSLSMAHLLAHSENVPFEARRMIQAAMHAQPAKRRQQLELAAKQIYRATDLQCDEIRDLLALT